MSSLNKKSGRVDILLCRISGDPETVRQKGRLDLGNVEIWLVELKKEEASFENGFVQLFDYLTVLKHSTSTLQEVVRNLKLSLERSLGVEPLYLESTIDVSNLYGIICAPAFDLIGRTTRSVSEGVRHHREDYESLEKALKGQGKFKEGFSFFDAVEVMPQISLVKLIRFRRGDEIIIFSENALGQTASTRISRVNPKELFEQGLIKEQDVFFFRDEKGQDHYEVKCKVLNKRGASDCFKIQLESVEGHTSVDIPKWAGDRFRYSRESIPRELTAKTCSIALHKLLGVYGEKDLFPYYWILGEQNFVRQSDLKSLSELRQNYRLSGMEHGR